MTPSAMWDGGPLGTGTDWNNAVNWVGDQLPGANDDVEIGPSFSGITVTSTNAVSINSLVNAGSLTLAGGTFALASSSTIQGAFTLTVGTLTGAGTLTVSGLLTWTGGIMSGSGQTNANGGLQISTAAAKFLDGQTLNNAGSAVWVGAGANPFRLLNGAQINNLGSAVFEVQGTTSLFTGGGGTPAFNNAGTFIRTGSGTSTIVSGINFTNNGTVQIPSGTFRVDSTLTNFNSGTSTLTGGTWQIVGTLRFNNANIVNNAANIVLDGASAAIVNQSNASALSNLAANLANGALTITNGRNLTTASSAFSNAGVIVIGTGSTLTVPAANAYMQSDGSTVLSTATSQLTASAVEIQSGTLGGNGTVNGNVTNAGQVNPGASPGALTINGSFTQTSSGILNVQLGGLNAGTQFDQLNVTGVANLDGTLNISLINGYFPALGSTFRFLVTADKSGDFATFAGLRLGRGIVLHRVVSPTSYELLAQNAPTLNVIELTPTTIGFTVLFSRLIDASVLNLYDAATGSLGPADVTLIGNTTGAIRGSLLIDSIDGRITFVRTGGPLLADSYSVTLRSASNAFKDTNGLLLDGNGDQIGGDDYIALFTVVEPPSNAVTVSIPDFARGSGQPVDVPATSTDLPLRLSASAGITSVELILRYDPTLLDLVDATVVPGLPLGADVNLDTSSPGTAVIHFTSPAPLAAGINDFVMLIASVPTLAPYGKQHSLDLSGLVINGGTIPALVDDGVHITAYLGDLTGNAKYTSADSSAVLQLAVGQSNGAAAYPLTDPRILADITGEGRVSSADATRILEFVTGASVPLIPPLPPPPAPFSPNSASIKSTSVALAQAPNSPLPARGAQLSEAIPHGSTAQNRLASVWGNLRQWPSAWKLGLRRNLMMTPDSPLPLPEAEKPYLAEELSRSYGALLDQTPWPIDGEDAIAMERATIEPAVDAAPPSHSRIVEALLFVGGAPLTAARASEIIRGLSPAQFVEAIETLNRDYRRQGRPYLIQAQVQGHVLALRPRFQPIVEKLFGAARAARLSSAAVDVLALVAYRQPVSKQEIDALRGIDSGSLLRQLVRRSLIAVVQRGEAAQRQVSYGTTKRFLDMFNLTSLDDLPQTQDLQKL